MMTKKDFFSALGSFEETGDATICTLEHGNFNCKTLVLCRSPYIELHSFSFFNYCDDEKTQSRLDKAVKKYEQWLREWKA